MMPIAKTGKKRIGKEIVVERPLVDVCPNIETTSSKTIQLIKRIQKSFLPTLLVRFLRFLPSASNLEPAFELFLPRHIQHTVSHSNATRSRNARSFFHNPD